MIIVEMNAIKRDELGKQANNKIRKSAVSYTHLTLPTKA
mgnify:CR=1 FL=1